MATMDEIREFADSLKADRLIRIKLGSNKDDEPFLISQRRMENASEYFRKALRQDSFKEGLNGQIDFPEDDHDSWASLKPDLLIKSWILGDKYGIPEFQDQAMLELLFYFERLYATKDIIKLGSELSPADSVLKRLIAEEAAMALGDERIGFEGLETAFGGNGMLRHFVLACDNYEADEEFYKRRFESLAADDRTSQDEEWNEEWRSPTWQNYMITNGSRPQWLFDTSDSGRWSD
ncbi:hypothetical protein KC331_g13631 [Hortaea werneckii]|uniref:Uncharacterized protein n=1 Tax=Hortaea werneckii TaxID=91943 RepID=A0A3M7BDY0_HORWE|nr:hypothetical protein KC331_g13631 [Hortaea werneckii]KAI7702888.1 hypothetical protein KC353_g14447 [Hortaea werneckii]RMY38032.1 hypothetical protein D0865_13198 [Hortaea werneckii]